MTQAQKHPCRACIHGTSRLPGAGLRLFRSELGRKPDDPDQNQVDRDYIVQ
jgi:hypothetical protein